MPCCGGNDDERRTDADGDPYYGEYQSRSNIVKFTFVSSNFDSNWMNLIGIGKCET